MQMLGFSFFKSFWKVLSLQSWFDFIYILLLGVTECPFKRVKEKANVLLFIKPIIFFSTACSLQLTVFLFFFLFSFPSQKSV